MRHILIIALATVGPWLLCGLRTATAEESKEATIKQRFKTKVETALKDAELKLTDEGKTELDRLADKAAAQLKKDEFSEKKLKESDKNLKILVEDLKEKAKDSGKNVIDASSIKKTLESLCPLYPFC